MFRLSVCFGMFDFGLLGHDFDMLKHFLLSCLSTFFYRPATCFGMFDFGMFAFRHFRAKMRSFWHVFSVRVLRHVWFWHVSALSPVGLLGMILTCLSTFFCRPATCFGMFDFGMFKFRHGGAKMRSFRHVVSVRVLRHVWFWHVSTLSSVGLLHSTHTHTHASGQVLVLLVVERQRSIALQQRCAATILQMLFLACKLSSCRSCRSVVVALAQLEVADDSSSTYTTTTQLQRVTQGKDAVIGSSSHWQVIFVKVRS